MVSRWSMPGGARVLILQRGDQQRIEAEATIEAGIIVVRLLNRPHSTRLPTPSCGRAPAKRHPRRHLG